MGVSVMCGRGRAERMAFADSFVQAYHFRLLYLSSAMMYPIMGAMRHSYGQPWEVIFFSICCTFSSFQPNCTGMQPCNITCMQMQWPFANFPVANLTNVTAREEE